MFQKPMMGAPALPPMMPMDKPVMAAGPVMPMLAPKPPMHVPPKHAFGKHKGKSTAHHAAQIKAAVQSKFPDLGQTAMVSQMKG